MPGRFRSILTRGSSAKPADDVESRGLEKKPRNGRAYFVMKNWNVNRWLGMLLIVLTVLVLSGCCARLQSPIVFDQCCNSGAYYSGCSQGYNNCSPCAPCNPTYNQ